MEAHTKSPQKTYYKGSRLYFSAGLVLTLVLVTTAFEWKTVYRIHNEIIELSPTADPHRPDMVVMNIPAQPRPKTLGTEIKETPTPPAVVDKIVEPPVPTDPIEPDPGTSQLISGLFGGDGPVEDPTTMPDITKAAVPANGYEAFYAYIYKHLKVPSHLIDARKGGKVDVSFVIDTNGRLIDVQVVKGFDKELEAQLIKLLEEAPAWEPAWQQGRMVKARMQLPVVIKIAN